MNKVLSWVNPIIIGLGACGLFISIPMAKQGEGIPVIGIVGGVLFIVGIGIALITTFVDNSKEKKANE